MGGDDQQKRPSRSAVEDWLASQIAAHLGVPDEEEDRPTERVDVHEDVNENVNEDVHVNEDVDVYAHVDVNDVATEPERTTEINSPRRSQPPSLPPSPSLPLTPPLPPSLTPTLPPSPQLPPSPPRLTRSPRPPLPRARHTSDLDGTDPDISDPGRPIPVEPELEDLEIVANLSDQSTVLRPPPARRAKTTPPPRPASPLSDAPTASPMSDRPTVVRRSVSTPPPGPAPRPPPPPPPVEEGDAFSDMLDGWTGSLLALLVFAVAAVILALILVRWVGTSP